MRREASGHKRVASTGRFALRAGVRLQCNLRQGGHHALACMDVESCIDTAGKTRRSRDRVPWPTIRLIQVALSAGIRRWGNAWPFGSPLTACVRPALAGKANQIEDSSLP